LTIAANAYTQSRGVACGARWPILVRKRLFSEGEFAGVSNDTAKPASAKQRAMRAAPYHCVAVATKRTLVAIAMRA
jgi:hypothetical protein